MHKLAPSILSADYHKLGAELNAVEQAGAHYAHIDIMDGKFVPNITYGSHVIKSVRKKSKLVFDVHLMIEKPDSYIEDYAEAGADIINFHVEAAKEPKMIIKKIKGLGKKAAMTLNPNTPVEQLYDYIQYLDMVLVMSVKPGFGGQEFIRNSLKRAETLRDFIEKNKLKTDIEMDGGIKLSNVKDVVNAGVNVLVVGSAIFDARDKKQAVKDFLEAIQ